MNLRAPAPKPPITAAEVPQEWIDAARETVIRCGLAIRAGSEAVIEIKSATTNRWCALCLPGSGTSFATVGDRDAVLAALNGRV